MILFTWVSAARGSKRKPQSFKDEDHYISSIPKNQVSFYLNYIVHHTYTHFHGGYASETKSLLLILLSFSAYGGWPFSKRQWRLCFK